MDKFKCQVCREYFNSDEIYEYRGFFACEKHFDELCEKVNNKREQVMETTEMAVKSQRVGEFINNRSKYNLNNVATDGLPIIKVKEPLILKEYEEGIL